MKNHYAILSAITIIVLVFDQITKLYIDRTIQLYQSIPMINGLFSITYMRNKGAAFSFLSGFNYRIPFFILISLMAVVAILATYRKLHDDQRFAALSLALILSSAMGNLIDRIKLSEVIDFLNVF